MADDKASSRQDYGKAIPRLFLEDMTFLEMLENMKPHDHFCLIYESKEEWRNAVIPFISIGLRLNEKCIYIVDTSTSDEIKNCLAEDGIDSDEAEKSGRLRILTEAETYTGEGSFDPDRMITLLIEETQKAVSQGYSALRVTGEMTWVLRGLSGSDRILEYEAKLNHQLFPNYPCIALCQYDRWKFDPDIIKGAIVTHPKLILGEHIYRNFYYIPPEDFLEEKHSDMEVQHWLNNIEREELMWEELNKSRRKYADLLEKLNSGVAVYEAVNDGNDFIFIDFNRSGEKIDNIRRDEVIGKRITDVFPGIKEYGLLEVLQRVWRTGNPERFPASLYTDSRITGWRDNYVYKLPGGEIVAVYDDITELKEAEDRLRESEAKLQTILKTATDGFCLTDMEGNILEVNDSYCRMVGYSQEELLGMSVRDLEVIDSPEEIALRIRNIAEQGYGRFETVHRCKNGQTIDIETSATYLDIENGQMSVFLRDISERKKAEDEIILRATLLDNASDGIVLFDREGRFVYVNDMYCRTHGYRKEELIGTNVTDIEPNVNEEWLNWINKEIRQKGFAVFEAAFNSKKGSAINLEVRSTKISLGNKRYTLCVERDITEREQAVEKERQLQQELITASRLATVGEMAAGIAHEINNPLTGVVGFTSMLIKKDIPEEIRNDLKIVYDNAQRIASITRRMLAFSRQQKTELIKADINEIIENTLEMRSYSMNSGNINVTRDFAPDLPMTVVDAGQIQQVFLNIILNAEIEMENAHKGGNLTVKTEQIDDNIRISFTDDGPGISRSNLDKIFNPFFTTRSVGKGVGLGLSVSHGIVTQHGGKIYARSKTGKGATFIVELPVRFDLGQTNLPEPVPDPPEVTEARILIVDDEAIIRDLLSRILEKRGFQVDIAEDGNEAFEKLKNEEFDVILLDVRMPGKSGTMLYEDIQEISQSLTGKIIFVTGDVMNPETMTYILSGEIPYVSKPFSEKGILDKIGKILNQE